MVQFYPSCRDNDKKTLNLLSAKCPVAYIDAFTAALGGPAAGSIRAKMCFVFQHWVRNVDRTTGHLTPTAADGDPFTTEMRGWFRGYRIDGEYVGPDPARPVGRDPFLGIGEDPLKRILDLVVSDDFAMIPVVRRVCRAWNGLGKFRLVGTQNLAVFAKRIGRTASVERQVAGVSKLLTFCDLDVSGLIVPWMLGNEDTVAAYASLVLMFMTKPAKVDGQRVALVRDASTGKAVAGGSAPWKPSLKDGFVKMTTENDHATQAVLMALRTIGKPTLALESYTCAGGNAILPINPGLRTGLFGPYTVFKDDFMPSHQATLVDLRVSVKDTPLGGVWPSLKRLCVIVNNTEPTAQAISETAVMPKLEHLELRGFNQAPSLTNVPTTITTLRVSGPESCSQGKNRYLKTAELARFTNLVDLRMRGACLNHNTDLTNALARLPKLKIYQNVLASRGRGKRDHPEAWGIEPIHKLLAGRVTDGVEVRRTDGGKWKPTTDKMHKRMLEMGLELRDDWCTYQRCFSHADGTKMTVLRHPGGLVSYRTPTAHYEVRQTPKLTLVVTPQCIGGIELDIVKYRHQIKSLVIATDRDAYKRNFAADGPFAQLASVVTFVAM